MLALSATYPESLAQHLTRYMREPTFVRLNPGDLGLKGKTLSPDPWRFLTETPSLYSKLIVENSSL